MIENQCDELNKLLGKLKPDIIIYEANSGNKYSFIEHKSKKLFFKIPSLKKLEVFYRKSITDKQFCELLKKLKTNKILTNEDFPFQDCRKSAFYGFVNYLFYDTFIKSKDKYQLKYKL
jgi:hypothetical protein